MSAEAKSKSELYLLKFQKYKEEKEKLRTDKGKKTTHPKPVLKSQNAVHKTKITEVNTNGTKTPKEKTKENKKPDLPAKKAVLQKQVVSSVKKNSNLEQLRKTFPISKSNPSSVPKKSLSSSDAKSSVGHVVKSSVSTRPGLSSQNSHCGNNRKSSGSLVTSKNNVANSRKSLPSYTQTNARKSFSCTSANSNRPFSTSAMQSKSEPARKRRYSDTQKDKKKEKPKPASILKRKSCFASFDVEGNVELGKTPDHGRSVRFISPDVQDQNCSNSHKFRKTPKRPGKTSMQVSTPVNHGTPKCSQKNMNFQQTPTVSSVKKPRQSGQHAQIAMRNKLDEWLKSKGKTPSKFRHLMCFHEKGVDKDSDSETDTCMKSSLTVDELTEQKSVMDKEESVVLNLADQMRDAALEELDSMLEECSTLYEAGCPREDILRWLDSIEKNIKLSKTYAKFYICKAQVLKCSENLEDVLKVYETAVINGAQPSHELAAALTGIVKDVCQEREKKARRRSVNEVQEENIFESSAIKYAVRQVTPFSKKRRKSASDAKQTSPCVVITPVRRSTRRSISCLPSSLQDKHLTYKSLEDVSDKDRKKTLYFPNQALDVQ